MKRLRGYTFVACAAALFVSSAVVPAYAGTSSTSQLPTQLRSLVNTRAVRTVTVASLAATRSLGTSQGRSDSVVSKLLAHALRQLVRAHVPADRLLPRQRPCRREPVLGIRRPRHACKRCLGVAEVAAASRQPARSGLARRRCWDGVRAVDLRREQRLDLRSPVRTTQHLSRRRR